MPFSKLSSVQRAILRWLDAYRRGESELGDRLTEVLRALELIGEDEGRLVLTDAGIEALVDQGR